MRVAILVTVSVGVIAGLVRAADPVPEGLVGQLGVSWVEFTASERSIAYRPFRVLPSGVVVGRVVTWTRVAGGRPVIDRASVRGKATVLGESDGAARMQLTGRAGKSRFRFVVREIPSNPGAVRGRGWIKVWGERVTGIGVENQRSFPRRIVVARGH